jgi:hypothetical protein
LSVQVLTDFGTLEPRIGRKKDADTATSALFTKSGQDLCDFAVAMFMTNEENGFAISIGHGNDLLVLKT